MALEIMSNGISVSQFFYHGNDVVQETIVTPKSYGLITMEWMNTDILKFVFPEKRSGKVEVTS